VKARIVLMAVIIGAAFSFVLVLGDGVWPDLI
jgi:hypothetical protein